MIRLRVNAWQSRTNATEIGMAVRVLSVLTALVAACGDDAAPLDAGRDSGSDAGTDAGFDAGPPTDGGHSCDATPPDAPDPGPDFIRCNYDSWCDRRTETCCIRAEVGWACSLFECRPFDEVPECAIAYSCTSRGSLSPCPGPDEVCCTTRNNTRCVPTAGDCDGVIECNGPSGCPPELPYCYNRDLESHDVCNATPEP